MEHIELKARKRLSSGQQHCHSSSDEDGQCERDEFLPMPLHSKRGEPSDHSGQVSLRKDITLCSGVALVAGQIIGSGIYVSPAIVLTYAGSFGVSLILWAVGALVAIFGSLCYVELGLLTRKSGGEFLYLVKAYSFRRSNGGVTVLGSLLGFISLWTDFCVARPSGLAVAVLLCAKYFIRPFFIGCCAPDLAVKCLAIAVLSKYCSHSCGIILQCVPSLPPSSSNHMPDKLFECEGSHKHHHSLVYHQDPVSSLHSGYGCVLHPVQRGISGGI